jgi:uncharacterized protein
MNRKTYELLETYMHACMSDSAHDTEHVYRVLYNALEIARGEPAVNYDVLIAACLLHDIGRQEQFADPSLCHAAVGSEKAFLFLTERGFGTDFAEKVRHCILTHRFRKAMPPQTIEAQILFDADKLDVSGAIGIARTLIYNGAAGTPIYSRREDGSISNGEGDQEDSFCREYTFKLRHVYDRFFTAKGAALAQERRAAAERFYRELCDEVMQGSHAGDAALEQLLE